MKDIGHRYLFFEKAELDIKSAVNARLDLIRNWVCVMVTRVHGQKSPQPKWLKFSQNAYLANT